ncbi:MAG TPA: hypothetical protein VK017_05330 [Sphingobacterium sp.]|jgi:hypothetical protein|nr:hypothetical protein [Sphingobacterium sp.]
MSAPAVVQLGFGLPEKINDGWYFHLGDREDATADMHNYHGWKQY